MNFRISKYIHFPLFIFVIFTFLSVSFLNAQVSRFTLVIDAGHGGHDPGAMGSISKEKDINLDVSLKFGALVERNFSDVKVVYTRKTDVYLTLQERADIVNNNHANLFVCIHTNSSPSAAAYGSESYTLGLARSKSNLDVAMRENSVILLEDDYKSKYRGFDPASVDSYIMFEFMQDKYIDKSVDLASNIQKQFSVYARRSDRGVRQAGFWVLHRSACPSVLVELGFISNPSEERYLSGESGQLEMAGAIYNAFVNFKREHDKKSGRQSSSDAYPEIKKAKEPVSPQKSDTNNLIVKDKPVVSATDSDTKTVEKKNAIISTKAVFKLQIVASKVKLNQNSSEFKGIKDVDFFREDGYYKYTTGAETEYSKILKIRKELSPKFPQSFIIAFVGDKKISVSEALQLNK